MDNESKIPQPRKRMKDMDRRPLPTHVDDFVEDLDADSTWIPGKKGKTKPAKDKPAKDEASVQKVRENITASMDFLGKIIVIVLSLSALAGIVALAIWVSSIYGIDLLGQFKEALSSGLEYLNF